MKYIFFESEELRVKQREEETQTRKQTEKTIIYSGSQPGFLSHTGDPNLQSATYKAVLYKS